MHSDHGTQQAGPSIAQRATAVRDVAGAVCSHEASGSQRAQRAQRGSSAREHLPQR